jgi:hypothetical protein
MITTELYWMNLEITLGLLACCLPSFRGLMKSSSVSKVVSSFRGLLSLGSSSTLVSEIGSKGSHQEPESEQGKVFITNQLDVETRITLAHGQVDYRLPKGNISKL